MLGTRATPMLAATCTLVATMMGSRRPTRSLHGPTSSWPTANPMVVAVSVNCTMAVDTSKSASTTGKAGRYRSMVKEPSAVRAPSTRT